jgi:hypothetical protein
MPEPNNAAKETPNSTGPPKQPTKKLPPIDYYRELIQNLSKTLIRVSWLELLSQKNNSVFPTVEEQLRDTIDNLEDLTNNTQGTTKYISDAVEELNNAYMQLLEASMRYNETDIEKRKECLNCIKRCREYLAAAFDYLKRSKGS